jgi:hypothetical protein
MAIGKVNKTQRLFRKQVGRGPRIPSGITPEDFMKIRDLLRIILQDIDNELKTLRGRAYKDDERPKELHIRLNESDKPWPVPIFVGWVESEDSRERRQDWNHPDPGLLRFGDDVYSEIYGEAFRYASRNVDGQDIFRYRNWELDEMLEKRSGEKATDPKAGNRFQTCLAMVIEGLVTGTLVVGFRCKPKDQLLRKTQALLREWAREPKSKKRSGLVDFLKKFELGGPRLEDSDWVERNY